MRCRDYGRLESLLTKICFGRWSEAATQQARSLVAQVTAPGTFIVE